MNPAMNPSMHLEVGAEPGMLSEDEEIYRENILDHYRSPRNKKSLEEYTFRHLEHNPVCGDKIELFIKLNGQLCVEEAAFQGEGCAISQASASMLTEKLKGMHLHDLQALKKEDVLDMLGIAIGLVRMKCALLSLKTLHTGIAKQNQQHNQGDTYEQNTAHPRPSC